VHLVEIWRGDSWHAPHCCILTRVLNLLNPQTAGMMETVPGQVVHSILVHFAGVANTTLQRRGQWEEVPGSGSSARTSLFNLSYHHKTPGSTPVRHLQPSGSNCCMSPGRLIRRLPRLRMRRQNRYFDAQQPAQKRQSRPLSSGDGCSAKIALFRASWGR
jgi:hypothetical protein